jgi:sigma-B regulation protein RsbU (phosphoserine phosphatase)
MSQQDKIAKLEEEVLRLKEELRLRNEELSLLRREVHQNNEELEGIVADLSHELRIAAKIQQLLSPTEIPNIPGIQFSTKFVPGTQSGGDYFDIFELHDKLKFGILVSSCSGYAMSALFMSVLMKYSAQLEAKKGLDPAQVLKILSQEILPQIQKQETASVFYGVIDRRNYDLSYCCIGSISGLLKDSAKDQVVWLEPSAGPLRKGFQENLLTHTISLGPQDQLALCTEGVLMARAHEEVFGKDRLIAAFKSPSHEGVHGIRNEILYQVSQFTGLTEPVKDQTVVVTEVKDKVIKLANKVRL